MTGAHDGGGLDDARAPEGVSTALLVGGTGQLGHHLRASVPAGIHLQAPSRDELDLLDDDSIARALERFEPGLVINAAAYTAVDRAESEPEAAFAVNAEGVDRLAKRVAETDGRLIHVSTDFVFDGRTSDSYAPGDPPGPLNVYGASKLAGEVAVRKRLPDRALIVRTAWLYSAFGSNFVLTMLRLLAERSSVQVVSDQFGSPTWAETLARAIWRWAALPEASGVRHWTDEGIVSWYELAQAIAAEAMASGRLQAKVRVEPIPAVDFPSPVARPRRSALDASASYLELGLEPLPWRDALRRMLASRD